jgi:hypothetical protein
MLAPAFALKVPAGHSWHALLPLVAAYWPGAHGTQADASVPPSVGRDVPAAQARQTEAPAAAEYVPAPQSTHALLPLV